jgi:predicted aspartyl protease
MVLRFPIVSAGLEVDVLVNLEAAVLIPLRLSGVAAPPVSSRGLIDTGSDITAVSLTILQQLGIQPLGQTTTLGIAGGVPVKLYRVSLHVYDRLDPGLPWISEPRQLVMELAPSLPLDLLIGMDIVRVCKLLVDGPRGLFTLEQ